MSFPNTPVPGQEWTHSNGITYIYNADSKTWNIKYEQATNTASLPLINPTSRYLPSAGASLPDTGGLLTQSDYNQWAFNSLVKVDETSRVDSGESAPGDADTNQLWYKPSTGSLYVYYNDGSSNQWVEIGGSSTGELQDLESVLTEGNAADKTILLSDGTDALVSLLPDEASIIIASDTDKKNPRVRLTHIDEIGYPNSQMQIELDGDGTRADFEFLQSIQSAHFNFDGDDKFILNKDGDAEFTGKLKAAAAEDNAELSTLGQVLGYVQGLQSEIDQINNSQDMGEWTYDSTDQYQDPGNYTIRHVQTQEEYDNTIANLQQGLNECLAANNSDPSAMSQCQRDYDAAVALVPAVGEKFVTNDWLQGEEIEFAYGDQNSVIHSFENVKVGQYIDIVNEDGSGFMFGEITAVSFGMWYMNDYITYKVIKSFGIAQGKAVVKIFSVADGITADDLTNFVRKDGDTMTGNLRLTADPGNDQDAVNRGWVTDAIQNAVDGGALADEYLPITGGVLTGNLVLGTGSGLYSQELIKSTRTSGYAFQVYNEASDSNPAFIHSNGNIRGAQGTFTDTLEVRGATTLKAGTHFEKGINLDEGAWIAGNVGFHEATRGIRFYKEDKSTHFADITRQGIVLENKIYADNLWTLKVQDASDANSKTLIYGDYSSGLILNEVGELNTNGNVNIGGNLSFTSGGTIDATSSTALSGRASLDIRTAADHPVVISSGSGYKKILSFYGFDGNQDDNRGETAYINADGKAYFNAVYANDEELATKTYVDTAQFKPAQLAWVFDGDKGTDTETPPTKRFSISENNGSKYLRFSFETNNGVNLGDGKFADTNVTIGNGPVGTIWEYIPSNGKWKLKRQFRVEAWRWNFTPPGSSSSHFEFRMSSSHGHDWTNLATGVQYYITVGGFF